MAQKLSAYRITLTDRKNRNFKREYVAHVDNESVAKQWAEKQRDAWVKHYDYSGKGSEFLNDPRTWIVRVAPENPTQPKVVENKGKKEK